MINEELKEKLKKAIFEHDPVHMHNGVHHHITMGEPVDLRAETEIINMIECDDDIIITVRQISYISDKDNNFVEEYDGTEYCFFVYNKTADKLYGNDLYYDGSWLMQDDASIIAEDVLK